MESAPQALIPEPAPAEALNVTAPESAARSEVPASTPRAEVDLAVEELRDRATEFARLAPREKAALLRSILPRLGAVAKEQVALACRAKGIDPESPLAGEEWLAGPALLIEHVRRLAESLDDIASRGRPELAESRVDFRRDGRIEARVLPLGLREKALWAGLDARVLFEDGVRRADVAERQASFYRRQDPEGSVEVVLASGTSASGGPLAALHALFVEGKVAILKPSPVDAHLVPSLASAFSPLIDRGFLKIVQGGADAGTHLAEHPLVGSVHLAGSRATHELLVWGPPGPDRDARKAANDPRLRKPISSALGNVGPVIVVPSLYARDELWYQARAVVSDLVRNASCDASAARVLVLPEGWAQRDLFLGMIERALAAIPPRLSFHPAAVDRHARIAGGRARPLRASETPGAVKLPWIFRRHLDHRDAAEPLFSTEALSGVLGEVSLGSSDPAELLSAATAFCNDRLWGTLSCRILAPELHDDESELARALDTALFRLRYGAIGVNQWPGLAGALAAPPWGAHPGSTLADPQSGAGFTHDTLMLGGVEKTIVFGPLRGMRRPVHAADSRRLARVGQALTEGALEPSWASALSVAWGQLRG